MKTLQHVAFFLIGIGIIGIIGYFCRAFFADPAVPLGLRVLAGIAAVGFVLLLGYVGWDRIQKVRQEPDEIKEVKY